MVLRVDKEHALARLHVHREQLGALPNSCLMCLLAAGKGQPDPIHQTEEAVVLLDRFGSRSGHLLVVARDHVEDVTELGVERYLRIQRLAYQAAETLERALSPRRLFVASLGAPRAVPMSFPHFHLHVIPLYEEDESTRPARVFSWTDGVVVYDEDQAAALTETLRRAWSARAQDATVPMPDSAQRPWGPALQTRLLEGVG